MSYDEKPENTGLIDIRPMDLADILEGTIKIYRSNPWVFVTIIAAVIGVPVYVSRYIETGYITPTVQDAFLRILNYSPTQNSIDILNLFRTTDFITAMIVLLAVVIISIFVAPIAQAAAVYTVSESLLGRSTTFADSIKAIIPKIWSLILAYFLVILVFGIFFAPFVLFVAVIKDIAYNPGAILGFMLAFFVSFVLMVFLAIKLMFIPHAIVLDKTSALSSFKRSFFLSSGYWFRTFGILFIVSLLISVIESMLGIFGYLAKIALEATRSVSPAMIFATVALISSIINFFVQPVRLIATTLIYYDLRIRKEGFDLVLLSDSLSRENS